MSIDFSTLQGLTIPEGVVTQITDASGRVIWAVQSSKPIVLEVEKITSDTYAGETTYTGEQFILLDIWLYANGTAKVTYGGLTKTFTDTTGSIISNAQQVFFGTFNGVSDSVATPSSGELTIEGDCRVFSVSSYKIYSNNKAKSAFCSCINAVVQWGRTYLINNNQFNGCTGLTTITIPENISEIKSNAFKGCTNLTSVIFEKPDRWYAKSVDGTSKVALDFGNDATKNAELIQTYVEYTIYRE